MTVDYQKVWNTMNDLEQVIAKVISAREMIDIANEAIGNHEYSRAEVMTQAAYEFLGYFIEEFDEKFKDAWKATVGDLRSGDKEYYEPNRQDSFWDNYQGSTVSSVQYTDEELNAMCDNAASEQEKEQCREYNLREAEYYDKRAKLDMTYDQAIAAGWTMTDDGFWIKEDKVKKWVLPVEECKDADTDKTEYFVSFPDDLLEAANLKEGDQVEWVDSRDGSYLLRKV